MLISRGRISAAACALACAVFTRSAGAQQSFPQTLNWGSGLVDIPVAWVSPVTGDFAFNYSGTVLDLAGATPTTGRTRVNSQGSFALSLLGRAELGVALYSDNPEWGLFGRALLVDSRDFRGQPGLARWMPSLAVGVRNVGPYKRSDRFGLGYDVYPTGPDDGHVADAVHQNFNTANTVYVVATKAFSLDHAGSAALPHTTVSVSLGYGDGLFTDDGGLGDAYASHATGGLFGGVAADIAASPNTTVSLMVENNAWEYNAGVAVDYRGVRAGAYAREIGSGSPVLGGSGADVYNSTAFAFTLGWRGNLLGVMHGGMLRDRATQLERELTVLHGEISLREERLAKLQLDVTRYEAQELLALEDRRVQAADELRAEYETLQRLKERLRELEEGIASATRVSSSGGKRPPR
jgi:hypothetical protein